MKCFDEFKAGLWDRREGSVKLPSKSCQSKGAKVICIQLLMEGIPWMHWLEDGLFFFFKWSSNRKVEQCSFQLMGCLVTLYCVAVVKNKGDRWKCLEPILLMLSVVPSNLVGFD